MSFSKTNFEDKTYNELLAALEKMRKTIADTRIYSTTLDVTKRIPAARFWRTPTQDIEQSIIDMRTELMTGPISKMLVQYTIRKTKIEVESEQIESIQNKLQELLNTVKSTATLFLADTNAQDNKEKPLYSITEKTKREMADIIALLEVHVASQQKTGYQPPKASG